LVIVAASFFLEGVSRPRRVTVVNLSILPLNALLAWALSGGQLGLPVMGAVGAARRLRSHRRSARSGWSSPPGHCRAPASAVCTICRELAWRGVPGGGALRLAGSGWCRRSPRGSSCRLLDPDRALDPARDNHRACFPDRLLDP
jgi:hypothetical protein